VHRRRRRQRGKQPQPRQPYTETTKSEALTTSSTVTHDLHVGAAAAAAHSDVATDATTASSSPALSQWFCYPEFGASMSSATGSAVASAECAHVSGANSSGHAVSSSASSTCVSSGSSSADTSSTAVRRVNCNRCVAAHHLCGCQVVRATQRGYCVHIVR
jgi:hypothetical protein